MPFDKVEGTGRPQQAGFAARHSRIRRLTKHVHVHAYARPLVPGTPAPDFAFIAADGAATRLSDLRGRKVLLAFFRNAACALCNLRVRQLIRRHDDWHARGLAIVAVFESPASGMAAHVGRQEAPFSLIADPEAAIYALYGVEVSAEKTQATIDDPSTRDHIAEAAAEGFALTPEEGANFHRIPAEFLIDGDGTIRVAHYGERITDHLPFGDIDRFAAG